MKNLRYLILVTVIFILGLYYNKLNQTTVKPNQTFLFKPISKKLKTLSKKEYSYEIQGYSKTIKTINIVKDDNISLFMQDNDYPAIYVFGDRFLLDLKNEVVAFNEKKLLNSLVDKNFLQINYIATNKEFAYIFIGDVLYRYDREKFRKIPFKFAAIDRVFADKNHLYTMEHFQKDNEELLVLNHNLKEYKFYKDNIYKKTNLLPLYAKDSSIYYWSFQQKGLLKAISLNNSAKIIVKSGFTIYHKDHYITQDNNSYSLYQFPKKPLVTFDIDREFDHFFVLKNSLYLINNSQIFAKVSISNKTLSYIEPIPFYSSHYDTNDNFVAFVKKGLVTILDKNLSVVKKYKIYILPNPFAFDINKKSIVAVYNDDVTLNNKKILTIKATGIQVALNGENVAIASYDKFKKTLYVDIFKQYTHTKSYTFTVDSKMLNDMVFYKDTIIVAFATKALIIKNGKIAKTVEYYKLDPYSFLKRVGNKAYLSYLNNLVEIDLRTLKTKYNSFHLAKEIKKGGDFIIKSDNFINMSTTIKFPKKEYQIVHVDDIMESIALKDYALFWMKDEMDKVLVFSKDRVFKLKLVSRCNKIFAIKPLQENKFAILDGDGFRIIDIDKELKNANH